MSEIALIPRGYRRMSKEERVEFAIKAKAEAETKEMKDKNGVKQAAQGAISNGRVEMGRRQNILGFWSERHPGSAPTELEDALINELVAIMDEYDMVWKDQIKEPSLYKRSLKIRKCLGIYIPEIEKDKKKKRPRLRQFKRAERW